MGRITSSIGLITGTPIQDTVDQLINLSSVPRNRLSSRNEGLKQQRSAITDLTVLSIGVQLAARSFGTAASFNRTTVTSSNAASISATRSGTPDVGSYSVRTLQTAGTQAFKSSTFASSTKPFGSAGTLSIRGGGYVDRSADLSSLNGGRGVEAGSIRITDRAGKSAVIDVSTATSVDDVLRAINESPDINVTATTDGDAIRLVDNNTGVPTSNLVVEELGGGETAADLGLRGINTAANSATGSDILRLSENTKLSSLRDGRGIDFGGGDDLAFTFRDGSTLNLEIGDFSREASQSIGKTGAADPSAALTFTAVEEGAAGDGVRIRFIDDPSVTAGNETVQRIETPGGSELVFSIDSGTTTANDIIAVLAGNEDLADQFTAAADGDGSGVIQLADTATLSGGAAIEAVADPDLGDLLRVLNDANPGRLRAELAPGGDSIRLVDLTEGAGEFTVADKGSSRVAANLGWDVGAVDGEITGRRLQSGLSTVSLEALGGGNGIGPLGTLDIQTADGATAAVDLSDAETLQDVINAVNASGLSIEAAIDRSGSGLQIRDLSAGTATAFTISSADETADLLGIEGSTTDVLIRGESLELQFVSRSTALADLNQGRGVGTGSFKITDSLGKSGAINLKVQNLTTVGELVDAINDLDLAVTAEVNETGDGIRLIDTGDGAETLTVVDSGNGTSARQLGLAGVAGNSVVDGELVSTLNGRQVDVIKVEAGDTLTSLAAKVRETSRFATATLLSGPSGSAAISITSARGGSAGRIALDSQGVDLGFAQTSRGRDAVIAIGDGDGGSPTIFRSSDGVFVDAVNGVTLTAKQISDGPVQLDIKEDRASVESAVKRFADQYNKLMDRIKELTFFNADTDEVGVLFGRGEVLRIENSLSKTLTTRINTGSSIRTAADIGLRTDSTGKLNLDTEKLQAAIERDPAAVESFFTDEDFGFAAKVDQVIERIAGEQNSSLINRGESLSNQIDRNASRIEFMNERLDSERERLLKQFNAMESAIAKLQSNQQYLSSITYYGDLTNN
jgi:flagellar hook-associated protein 2